MSDEHDQQPTAAAAAPAGSKIRDTSTSCPSNTLLHEDNIQEPIKLQLYSTPFKRCSHCNLPPLQNKKLLSCSNCTSAAYHNSSCQRSHWRVHKPYCTKLSKSLLPLKELIYWNDVFIETRISIQQHDQQQQELQEDSNGGMEIKGKRVSPYHHGGWCWWHPNNNPTTTTNNNNIITKQSIQQSNHIWNVSIDQWNNNQEYLSAMEGMQLALRVYQTAWQWFVEKKKEEGSLNHMSRRSDNVVMENEQYEYDNDDDATSFIESSMILAKRLLFLAYCEMDGGQINCARQRLVQCISIANAILYYYSTLPSSYTNNHHHLSDQFTLLLNDAYMELTLSMEEVESDKPLARHVANMAISNGNCCGWVHPMQRPGYMASNNHTIQELSSVPISLGERLPGWCIELERNYELILEEYWNTITTNQWMDVGCGQRGSGHDDHSVVSGMGWKEYVLFGTGALDCEDDAPFTKKLLRQHVPDAVTLAQEGGGEVIFSRLSPHTHIKPHCGPTNLRWTAHLGLVIPKSKSDCRIRVCHEWVSWEVGKILLFDDSFEHEVRNDTDEERVVLLIRLWHPELMTRVGLASQLVEEAILKKEESIQKRYNPPT